MVSERFVAKCMVLKRFTHSLIGMAISEIQDKAIRFSSLQASEKSETKTVEENKRSCRFIGGAVVDYFSCSLLAEIPARLP